MRNFSMLILILSSFATSPAFAAAAKVSIISPVDGAKLSARAQNKMEYEVTLGGAGDHVHVYVDDKQVALLRQMKGSYTFESLERGKRLICIEIVDKNHTQIDVGRCVKVTVE